MVDFTVHIEKTKTTACLLRDSSVHSEGQSCYCLRGQREFSADSILKIDSGWHCEDSSLRSERQCCVIIGSERIFGGFDFEKIK